MSIQWAEGFDHYGTTPNGGRDAMLAGVWAAFAAGNGTLPAITNERARTGSYSLKFVHNTLATAGTTARRVFDGDGCAYAVWFEALPATSGQHGLRIHDADNNPLVKITVQSDGGIGIYAGSGATTLLGASDPVVTAGAWHHLEFQVVMDEVVGSVEVRVDGDLAILVEDEDLGAVPQGQIVFGSFGTGGGSLNWFLDDVVPWTTAGTVNNGFIGAVRVNTTFCDADVSPVDWSITGAATASGAIDEVPADGDTSYITAPDVGDIVEMALPDVPDEVSEIRGVYVTMMARLSDTGTGSAQVSMVSNGDVSEGPDNNLTATYTYWDAGVYETDPDTGNAWTPEALSNARLRIERTL